MDKKEEDILKKIEDKTQETDVPEKLSPQQMEQVLEQRFGEKEIKKTHHLRWKPAYMAGISAACCVLVLGIFAYHMERNQGTQGASSAGMPGHMSEADISDNKKIAHAKGYHEIYSYVKKSEENIMLESSGTDAFNAEEKASDNGRSASSYSDTNVRQAGVDEGDVVKTDGRYLYVQKENGHEISIVDTAQGRLKEISAIELERENVIVEMYLDTEGKKLVVLCSVSDGTEPQTRAPGYMNASQTRAITYTLSDIETPEKVGEVTQSGTYKSSRMSGGYLYLFSEYYANANAGQEERDRYVPAVNGKILEAEDIYLPQWKEAWMYEVVTSVKLGEPDAIADSKAILSRGGELYVSNGNIYFYENVWIDGNHNVTTVRKISYQDGKLEAQAQGKFDGTLNDSFSIDEYEDNLRVVVADGETNSVYVLDEKLDIIGSIEGLAKDERVHSARFMGDTGYFVTYRETDPLFSVDLSNPRKPKIIGALKIPGFSEYLHFYGENKLLGIGMDMDEETQVSNGVKLTMFDIRDKADVKEEQTYVLENVYDTEVFYNYKAVLVDNGRNLIGFSAYGPDGETYYLLSYEESGGFSSLMSEAVNGSAVTSARGVYIDKTLYIVKGNTVESYSLNNYEKIDDIVL